MPSGDHCRISVSKPYHDTEDSVDHASISFIHYRERAHCQAHHPISWTIELHNASPGILAQLEWANFEDAISTFIHELKDLHVILTKTTGVRWLLESILGGHVLPHIYQLGRLRLSCRMDDGTYLMLNDALSGWAEHVGSQTSIRDYGRQIELLLRHAQNYLRQLLTRRDSGGERPPRMIGPAQRHSRGFIVSEGGEDSSYGARGEFLKLGRLMLVTQETGAYGDRVTSRYTGSKALPQCSSATALFSAYCNLVRSSWMDEEMHLLDWSSGPRISTDGTNTFRISRSLSLDHSGDLVARQLSTDHSKSTAIASGILESQFMRLDYIHEYANIHPALIPYLVMRLHITRTLEQQYQ